MHSVIFPKCENTDVSSSSQKLESLHRISDSKMYMLPKIISSFFSYYGLILCIEYPYVV